MSGFTRERTKEKSESFVQVVASELGKLTFCTDAVVNIRLESSVKGWGDDTYQSSACGKERLGCGDGLDDFECDLCVEVCDWVGLGERVLCAAGAAECNGWDTLLQCLVRNSTTGIKRKRD